MDAERSVKDQIATEKRVEVLKTAANSKKPTESESSDSSRLFFPSLAESISLLIKITIN
jgi:hypothetical protein